MARTIVPAARLQPDAFIFPGAGRTAMKKALVAAFLLLVPDLAFAEWKVERGIKVGSLHDD